MSFVIDLVILALLVGTLAYAWLVDRRVHKMMGALRELEPMIGTFSEAVDRSESTLTGLRAARETAAAPGAREHVRQEPKAPRPEGAFRTRRERPVRPADATKVTGKSELVRGFFDTVRQREA